MVDDRVILAGAIPAAILALSADFRRWMAGEAIASAMMRLLRICLSLPSGSDPLVACEPSHSDRIVVGSKNFTESFILGELIAQQIETHTNLES